MLKSFIWFEEMLKIIKTGRIDANFSFDQIQTWNQSDFQPNSYFLSFQRDCTLAFRGHSNEAVQSMKEYEIGILPPSERIYRYPGMIRISESKPEWVWNVLLRSFKIP